MKNKYIINWELSLKCNLDCYFCSQKERRYNQNNQLSFDEINKIIENLPYNSHISFLWWETLIFPKIKEIFELLEKKWLTYEITTNWMLLSNFIETFEKLKQLEKINISIDWYWEFQDISRWKKWLFKKIIKVLPKLLKVKSTHISTVINYNLDDKNLLKLYLTLNKLWIKKHKLIYLMNFSKKNVEKSKQKIKELSIALPWDSWEEKDYKTNFLRKYKLLKNLWLDTDISIEPISIFKNKKTSCKQIDKQFRINEKWKLSICEFIENEFSELIKTDFKEAIKDSKYNELREKIMSNFPLDICKTCCKNYSIWWKIH